MSLLHVVVRRGIENQPTIGQIGVRPIFRCHQPLETDLLVDAQHADLREVARGVTRSFHWPSGRRCPGWCPSLSSVSVEDSRIPSVGAVASLSPVDPIRSYTSLLCSSDLPILLKVKHVGPQ